MTVKRASELLRYDKDTGRIFWRVSPCNAVKKGAEAGSIREKYRVVKLDYVSYPVHHIVWLLNKGEMPPKDIDHIDGNSLNNSIENLRVVTKELNQRNRRKAKNNTSGITGVHWDKVYNRWVANIKVSGKSIFLGGYYTKEEAGAARLNYIEKHKELGFTDRHGK